MYSNVFGPLAKMATMPILGICVLGSYDYPGSSWGGGLQDHHGSLLFFLFFIFHSKKVMFKGGIAAYIARDNYCQNF